MEPGHCHLRQEGQMTVLECICLVPLPRPFPPLPSLPLLFPSILFHSLPSLPSPSLPFPCSPFPPCPQASQVCFCFAPLPRGFRADEEAPRTSPPVWFLVLNAQQELCGTHRAGIPHLISGLGKLRVEMPWVTIMAQPRRND